MTTTATVADPLTILPPEIILQILEFTPVASLASLTVASKAWHQFIDVTHQDAIYASQSKTRQPVGGARDLSFLSDTSSFSKVFEGTTSWKDLCKRQTLLARTWADQHPLSQESVLQIGNDPVWRFRADFKRRFFISTSHAGGLNVTDMDSGRVLWRLPSTLDRDEDAVRQYAHLEYQDGMAVFDREGDAVEVWQTDLEGLSHGEFRRIAVLNHNCQTRGFQLSYWTLCVVSNQGKGFVYDMTQRPPKLTKQLNIEHGAVGHLDQSQDAVIYSMGTRGYHFYDKRTGTLLGVLHPSHCTDKYHIRPPSAASYPASAILAAARHGPAHRSFPPGPPRRDCLAPIQLFKGGLPPPEDPDHVWYGEDEWGAGMLHGDLFVGFSRAGRVFLCPDWRKAIHNQSNIALHSSLIECESDGTSFDLGGWLSVHNHRIMFEIQDRIYVVALDDYNRIQDVDRPARASYSMPTSSAPQLSVPVSFMALCDDAIMTTYTTLGTRQSLPDTMGNVDAQQHENHGRIFPTKAIRVVSLVPDFSSGRHTSPSGSATPGKSTPASGDSNQERLSYDIWRSQAVLSQLVSMLGDEFGEDEDEIPELAANHFDGPIDSEWEDIDGEAEEDEQDLGRTHTQEQE